MEHLRKPGASEEEQELFQNQQEDLLNELLGDAQQEFAQSTDAQIGRMLRGYLCEADHGGWEGAFFQDLVVIKKLIQDFGNSLKLERDYVQQHVISYGSYGTVNPDGSLSNL